MEDYKCPKCGSEAKRAQGQGIYSYLGHHLKCTSNDCGYKQSYTEKEVKKWIKS